MGKGSLAVTLIATFIWGIINAKLDKIIRWVAAINGILLIIAILGLIWLG